MEYIKKEIDTILNNNNPDSYRKIHYCIYQSVHYNDTSTFKILIDKISKLYNDGIYEFYFLTIYKKIINSSNPKFFELIDNCNLPKLKDIYYKYHNIYIKNSNIYSKYPSECYKDRNNDEFKYHLKNCKSCSEICINYSIKIINIELLNRLINHLNVSKDIFVNNVNPINKDIIKLYITEFYINPDFVLKLFTRKPENINISIKEQFDILTNLYDQNYKKTIDIVRIIIIWEHFELCKNIIDMLKDYDEQYEIMHFILKFNKKSLFEFFCNKLKNENKTDQIIKLINDIGYNIDNIDYFNIYQNNLGEFIKNKTYHEILKKQNNSANNNNNIDFIMELTKYDTYIEEDDENLYDTSETNNFENDTINNGDEYLDYMRNYQNMINNSEDEYDDNIITMDNEIKGEKFHKNEDDSVLTDIVSFKIDDNTKYKLDIYLKSLNIYVN